MTLPVGHRAAAPDTYQRILDSISPNAGRLKESYNSHLVRALVVAVNLHLLGLAAYWVVAYATATPRGDEEIWGTPPFPLLPEPLIEPPAPRRGSASPSGPDIAGIPTPAPDDEADSTATIAENDAPAVSGVGPATGLPGDPAGDVGGGALPPRPYVPQINTTPPPVPTPPTRVVEEPTAVFDIVEIQPVLIGGIEGIQSKIEYPSFDRSARNEGRVIVAFVVDENGVPGQIIVARSVTPGLDAAAVAAVREARFTPGRQNGRAVKVRFTLPVTFRLR